MTVDPLADKIAHHLVLEFGGRPQHRVQDSEIAARTARRFLSEQLRAEAAALEVFIDGEDYSAYAVRAAKAAGVRHAADLLSQAV